jgi:YVTN family beta-propeller protein
VSARRRRAAAGLGLAAFVAACGLGARRWSVAHVEHYTGDRARTTDCYACHVAAREGAALDRILDPRYRTPLDVAVAPDGSRLYVTAQDAGALLVVDAEALRLLAEIPAGRRPHSVALDAGGRTAYVTDQESDAVLVVDLASGRAVGRLPAGFAPAGVASVPGGPLVVANSLGGDLSVVDPASAEERARLAAGSYPYGAVVSPGGDVVLVTNQLARPARPPALPVSEVTLVDARAGRVTTRVELPNAHLLEGAAFTPDGAAALVTLVRPKNLVPALQVERGWMMTNGIAVLDVASGRAAQMPLDEEEAYYADPSDVAVTPDGRRAFVSHGGVDVVTAIDLPALLAVVRETPEAELAGYANRLDVSRRYVLARIPVGSNPRGLAVSPDGRRLYVAERLDDRIGVVDVAALRKAGSIDLEGPRRETLVRRGERNFNSARFTFQNQFSCRSCHPDNHMDRLQYDFEPDGLGRNVVDNKTMLGLRDTAPYKWNGRNTSLYMQCGIRFARFLMRTEPFPVEELNALVAFLMSLDPPRNRHRIPGGALTPAQRRGKEIFERARMRDGAPIPSSNRCVTCHRPPRYTDRRRADVGSASPGDTETAFDTPHLEHLPMSAPYLHDGKALTLEEIWTLYSPDDTHGVTSDLGKDGLNDLIEYLKTL